MNLKFNTYTGKVHYNGIDFSYVFSENELRLIPGEKDEKIIITQWLHKEIAPGAYTSGDPLIMKEPFLEATCDQMPYGIVFITQVGSTISSINSQLFIKVIAHLENKTRNSEFSQLSLSGTCINYVYPVNRAYVTELNYEKFEDDGLVAVKSRGFKATSTEERNFIVDGTEVAVRCSIGLTSSSKIGEPPLSFHSNLTFSFAPTSDYQFAYKLVCYAKKLLGYLTFQQEIGAINAHLSYQRDDGRYSRFAEIYFSENDEGVDGTHLHKGRYIKIDLLEGKENLFLQDIVDNVLYLRHLPRSNRDKNVIDASKFVLFTAAFEWEYRRLYPDGFPKDEKREKGEREAFELIQQAIDATKGETKKALKWAQKGIGFSSLQSKCVHTANDLDDLVGTFGRHLYKINGEELNYSSFGERLAKQRNNFAHGNMDKDFAELALLDIMFLKYLVLAMQLRYYGISDDGIRKAINELFGLGFAL